MSPAVSVVMATWNRPQFLGPAITSVLGQTFADFELVIVDDGSDLVTRELLRAVHHSGIRILWREHCGLPARVRNAGLHAAQGHYVAFMDSDDVWLPTKLERQIEGLRARPQLRWGYTACAHIDESGELFEPAGVVPWRPHSGPMHATVACLQAHSALPTVVAERELVLDVGGFDERMPLYEDHDLWLKLALRSEPDVIHAPLVRVRRHGEHYSGRDALLEARCRARFFESAWLAYGRRARPPGLRRLRALAAARLARTCAEHGRKGEARRTLRDSLRDGFRHPRWWRDAVASMVSAAAPRGPR
jgi:glycosyltransferase involved in cell wall biosynthesis